MNQAPKLGEAQLLAAGTRVDHFEIQRLIGQGGMGEVYCARDVRLGRKVALKFLRPQRAGTAEAVRRLRAEASALAQFSHPHIVAIYFVGELDGAPYLALEYIEGENLFERVRKHKPSVRDALRIGSAIAQALAEAHRHQTVHCDLKPQNVLLPHDGRLRVADFGIAKLRGHDAGPVELGSASPELDVNTRAGTPAYMAPEQWRGEPLLPAVDVWALGVILFDLLAGRHPYGDATRERLRHLVGSTAPAPRLPPEAADPDLVDLVAHCLEKDAARRPTAQAVAARLDRLLSSAASSGTDSCPYPGMVPYDERAAALFFGRESEIEALLAALREQACVLLIGPSGAGKSSFLRAGLIPRIEEQGGWRTLSIRPGPDAFRALSRALLRLDASLGSLAEMLEQSTMDPLPAAEKGAGTASGAPRRPIREEPCSELGEVELARRLSASPGLLGAMLRQAGSADGCKILLAIDQAEELFTLCSSATRRERFIRAVLAAADELDGPISAVFALRDDFFARMSAHEVAARMLRSVRVLRPPDRQILSQILTQPLERVGYQLEDAALVQEILEDVPAHAGSLPLLQFAMRSLWERRDPARRVLLRSAYREVGGVGGALVGHADTVLCGLSSSQLATAKDLLLQMVSPEHTRRALPRAELLRELPEAAAWVLDRLVEARLLAVHTTQGGGEPLVELAHESLVHSWPQLARWLAERRVQPVYDREEISAATRLHRVALGVIAVLASGTLITGWLAWRQGSDVTEFFVNFLGECVVFVYAIAVLAFLRRGAYSGHLKYASMATMVTVATLVCAGHVYSTSWVHATRTVTVSVYFLIIASSGIFYSPRLCAFTGVLSAVQYSALFATAVLWGGAPLDGKETFEAPTLSLDVAIIYVLMLLSSGALAGYAAQRQRQLLQEVNQPRARSTARTGDL